MSRRWRRACSTGADAAFAGEAFNGMLADPVALIGWMIVAVVIGFLVCSLGLQKGVERITKVMMATLFVVMLALCIRAVTLPGAAEGIAFYLVPDFSRLFANGWSTFGEAVYAAMARRSSACRWALRPWKSSVRASGASAA